MRIALFGASLVSAYENGASTYCRGIVRALAARGHSIRFYEPLFAERLAHRDILDPAWAQVLRFDSDGEGVEAALEHAADADVLIKCSDVGVFDDLLDAALPHCAAPPAVSVYWDMHPAQTLARLTAAAPHPLRAQLPWYDLVLVRYGRDAVVEAYQRCGARACFPAYAALDADVHFPVARQPDLAASMVLLAHRKPEREAQVARAFFDVAAALPGRRFVLGGCGWEDLALPANVRYVGYVYTNEHNLYNASASAALNLTDPAAAEWGYAPTARLFEAAGAGACLISDGWTGIEAFLEPEREVLIAQDGMQTIERLIGLSADRAAAIGQRARKRCRSEHTYERRAIELEALLEGFDRSWVNKTAL